MQGTITGLEPRQRGGITRFDVYLDGRYAFSLAADVVLAAGLREGDHLDSAAAARVLEGDQVQAAFDAALGFLGHRPRSEQEIRRRLARLSPPPTVVERVIERLRTYGLVDDRAFAAFWLEQRQTHRPRGARLLRAELRQRGVPGDLAAEASETLAATAEDDAYRAARKKAAQLASLDERTFRQRLGQFLARRGFDWDVVTPTVERLWRETTGSAA